MYFATFPSEYLETLRNVNVDVLKDRKDKIRLNHTQRYNLFNTSDRTEFIKEFVALLRFVAAGEANVGHLRKDSNVIHRNNNDSNDVLHPPQEAMDDREQDTWRELYGWQYAE